MKIEIVTTSSDALKHAGFGSLQACNRVVESMTGHGYDVTLRVCNYVNDLADVVRRKPDVVVLAVKYIATKNIGNIWLTDYFKRTGVHYLGSSTAALKFDSNKALDRKSLRDLGINMADFFTVIPDQYKSELPIKFPLSLKQVDAANGHGVDDLPLVESFSDFEHKVASLYEVGKLPILAEKYVDGRDFTVSIIQRTGLELIVSAVEVALLESSDKPSILGQRTKPDGVERLQKIEEGEMKDGIKKLAVDTFVNLGARDFGQIAIKSDQSGKCFFMEANLVPDMAEGSSRFLKACEIDHGLTYDETVKKMLAPL